MLLVWPTSWKPALCVCASARRMMNLPTLERMADYETLMYVVCIYGMERYIINYNS